MTAESLFATDLDRTMIFSRNGFGGAEAVAKCEPVYESMPGWSESTVGITRYEDLPAAARAYLGRLAELSGAPLAIVSTGPDRNETIVLQHPFD